MAELNPLFTEEEYRRSLEQARPPLPEMVSFTQLCKEQIAKPTPIIHELFDQGSSMVIGGGSKTFKSWAMSDMAVSICHGADWWGFTTVKGPVIYCNFELKPYYCRERFLAICKIKEVRYPENLFIWNLRGHKVGLEEFRERLLKAIETYGATCAFVDPFYKLLGAKDERISAEMMPILDIFEEINTKTPASIVCAAHFTKGNQAAKDPLDRISGGGALNRHPDCLITLTRHETDEAFTTDLIVRDFAPVDPFVVRWEYPLFVPDVKLDPAKLKEPKVGRHKFYSTDTIIELLKEHDDELSTVELQQLVHDEAGMSSGKFYELWKEIIAAKLVFKSKLTNKWNLKA